MSKYVKKVSKSIGLPPGTLVQGEQVVRPKITVLDYDENEFREIEISDPMECEQFKKTRTISWINVVGVGDVKTIETIGNIFNIHSLVLEDIVHLGQRPKYEESGESIFIVLRVLQYDEKKKEVRAEQVSFILGPNFVISFEERPTDVFDHVRESVRHSKGRVRKLGTDYLVYSLIDTIVDNYFIILERFGEEIEKIEERLVTDPRQAALQMIHNLKRDTIFLRRSVWPLREVINRVDRDEGTLFHKNTRVYLKDLYDHIIQIIDTIETFRDMLMGMQDLYLSSISNKMNEVMRVLTIIATIFIPLTFIVGVYGMNFKYMPELEWKWSYFIVLVFIIIVGVSMFFSFKRKKWL